MIYDLDDANKNAIIKKVSKDVKKYLSEHSFDVPDLKRIFTKTLKNDEPETADDFTQDSVDLFDEVDDLVDKSLVVEFGLTEAERETLEGRDMISFSDQKTDIETAILKNVLNIK